MSNHLSQLAEAEINDLKEQGIEPTLNEIVWINDLARKVENPDYGKARTAIGRPIPAGGAWLWPFSIQGYLWYTEVQELFDDDDYLDVLSMAYSLAHSREVNAFAGLYDYKAVKKAVLKWAKGLTCTHEELLIAVTNLLGGYDEGITLNGEQEEADTPDVDYDYIISMLCTKVGNKPDYWLSEISREYVFKLLHTIHIQEAAENNLPDENDPHINAVRDLGRAILYIKEQRLKDA